MMLRRPSAAAVLLAAFGLSALLTGCHRDTAGKAAAGKLKQPDVHVVLFMIDTLRADRVGAYGCPVPTTPMIDELARHGVVFEQAQAPAPWTCPSVPSIFTSTFACEHQVTADGHKLSPAIPTMAERFKKLGYQTVSLYVNTFAGPLNGMDRGFDIAVRPQRPWVDGRLVDRYLSRLKPGPFFLYVHNLEPHNPFNAPPKLIRLFGDVPRQTVVRLGKLLTQYRPLLRWDWDHKQPLGTTDTTAQQDRLLAQLHEILPEHRICYDAVVRLADMRLASVIRTLKARGVWDKTLLIVLSDHGEEFAEHGAYLHSQSVYRELTHVPLVIRFPNDEFAGTRVRQVVSLVDVLPTIFDYLGRPDVIGLTRGQSLMPLIRGEAQPDDEELVLTTVRINLKKYYRPWALTRGNVNVAVMTRDGRWKLIWNVEHDTVELYDHRSDPDEQHNVCEQYPDRVRRMTAFARRAWQECQAHAHEAEQTEIPEEQREQLEALGYLGGLEAVEEPPQPVPATAPASLPAGGNCPAPR